MLTLLLLLALFALFMLPGALLALLLRRHGALDFDMLQLLPLAFCFGLLLYMPPYMLAFCFHLSWTWLTVAYAGIGCALAAAAVRHGFAALCPPRPQRQDVLWWGGILFLIIVPLLVWGPEMQFDTYGSISYLRKLAASPVVTYVDSYYLDVQPDPLYVLDGWHALLAHGCRLLPVDPLVAWQYATVLAVVFMLTACLALARATLRTSAATGVALMLLVMLYGYLEGFWVFSLALFPIPFAMFVLLPVGYLLLLSFIRAPSSRLFAVTVISYAVMLLFVHAMALALFVSMAGGMVAIRTFTDRRFPRRLALLLALILLACAPLVAAKWRLGRVANTFVLQPFSFVPLGDGGWGYFEPLTLIIPDYVLRMGAANRWMYLLAYPAAVALLPFARRDAGRQLLCLSAVLPPVLLFCPFTAKLLAPLMTHYLLRRFAMLPLVYLLLTVPVLYLAHRRPAVKAIGILLLVAALTVFVRDELRQQFAAEFIASPPRFADFRVWPVNSKLDFYWSGQYAGHRVPHRLLATLRDRSFAAPVIITDRHTGMYLAAYTKYFVFDCFPDVLALSCPPEPQQRRELLLQRLRRGQMGGDELAGVMREYQAGAILLPDSDSAALTFLRQQPFLAVDTSAEGYTLFRRIP